MFKEFEITKLIKSHIMKNNYNLSKLILVFLISLLYLSAYAQPAGDPIYYEGHIYPTIIIGNQCWMTENLNVGTMIPGNTDPANNGIFEKLCYNDDPANCDIYGGLYRWNELMQYQTTPGAQGICPSGWHIPSDTDWSLLTNNYPQNSNEYLIAGGSSGFDALLGGYGNNTGGFYYLNSYGVYFTSTTISVYAYRRTFSATGSVERAFSSKSDAYSVRCMRNSLTQTIPFSISISGQDVNCFGGSDGIANLTVSGASNPSFIWSNGATTEDLIGVPVGTYSVTVTENSQSLNTSVTINQPSTISQSTLVTSPITCFNGADGAIGVNVTGGTSPYSFSWSNGINSQFVSSLPTGVYTVTTTDANACEIISSINLQNPPLNINIGVNLSNVSCNGLSDGAIDLNVSGTGPFSYIWSNGQVTQDLNSLSLGLYSVTVSGGGNCSEANITVSQPDMLAMDYSVTNASNQGVSDGQIDITVLGGTSPFSFSWSNGATIEDIAGLSAGSYYVTITDDNNCSYSSQEIIVTEPGIEVLNVVVTDITCNGLNNGSISIVATGNSLLTYHMTGYPDNVYGGFWGLSAGNYTVTITDQQSGVAIVNDLIIIDPDSIQFTTTNSTGCSGENIEITATGGTPPYTYSIDGTNFQSSNVFLDMPAGNYTVYVKDINDCEYSQGIVVNQVDVMIVDGTVTDPQCYGSDGGSIQLSVINGQPNYTFNWSNGQTTSLVSGLYAGQYSVTVTDANGCMITDTYTVNEAPEFSLNLSGSNITSPGGSNGAVMLSIIGGSSPYTFLWSNGAQTQNISGLVAGNYAVTVTDNSQCTATGEITLVEDYQVFTIDITQTDVSCNGGSNGSASASVTGGTAPYSYLWSNGATNSSVFGLSAGNYSLTVTDNNMVTDDISIVISEPSALSAGLISNNHYNAYDVSCATCSDGQITASGIGGTPPYSFTWSTAATSNVVSGLSSGQYFVTVTDNAGCIAYNSITLDAPDPLQVNVLSQHNYNSYDISCNGNNDGGAIATVSGGIYPYSYQWSTGSSFNQINGISYGNYYVTVTDAYNNTSVGNIFLTQPPVFSVSVAASNITIPGGSNGSILLTPNGGVSPYFYSWSTGQTTQNLVNLSQGNYYVTASDLNSCQDIQLITLVEDLNPVSVSATSTNVTCNGASTGSATATASGGTTPYSFVWSNGYTTANINGLSAGIYTVTVTDYNSSTASATVIVSQPGEIIPNVNVTSNYNGYSTSCYTCNDGSASVSATGGVPPYTYNWSSGSTSNVANSLSGGTYFVSVTDQNQCTVTSMVTLTKPNPIQLTISVLTDFNGFAVSCNGASDGSADVAVQGGVPPYSYSWSSGATSQTATGLSAGNYSLTITDANGIPAVGNIYINQPAPLDVSYTKNDITCFGLSDGSIQLSVSGGTQAYSYLWSNGQTTDGISNLSIGLYSVTVNDANGCTASQSIIVYQPLEISVVETISNVSFAGASDGSISLNVDGGTLPYSFVWSNGATTQNISGLQTGMYYLTISDANSCTLNLSYEVTQPSGLSSVADIQNVSCFGLSDGEITLTTGGGLEPYQYIWNTGQTDATISGLSAGTYLVTVTDANLATFNSSYEITEPTELVIDLVADDVTCYGGTDGQVSMTINGGQSPYSYLWSNGETTMDIMAVPAGTYMVFVSDANDCMNISGIDVNQPDEFIADVQIQNASDIGISDGAVTLSVSGNTAPYTYLWSTGATTSFITDVMSGSYYALVLDANSCDQWINAEVLNNQGTIYGCTDPAAANYNPDATLDDGSCIYIPNTPDWTYSLSSSNHTVLIPDTIEMLINGAQVEPGDFIGVFFDSLGTLACAGYTEWNGVVTTLSAWGDDSQTSEKDGFAAGEVFTWKVFDASSNAEYIADATYFTSFANDSTYAANGMSALAGLNVVTIETQTITLLSSWSIISTYIIPTQPDIADVLSDVVSDVSIVKDENGQTYWPLYSVNLIGDLSIGKAYQIKMNVQRTLVVEGLAVNPEVEQVPLSSSWNLLGYLRKSSAPIETMLAPIASNVNIVKDYEGSVYWPLYGVNLINTMYPGQGYQIKMDNADTLVYPANTENFPTSNSKSVKLPNTDIKNTGRNMTLGIPLNTWDNLPAYGDMIYVYSANGYLCGASEFTGKNMAIAIWGNDDLSANIDGLLTDEEFYIYKKDKLSGNETNLIVEYWQSGEGLFESNEISIVGKIKNEIVSTEDILVNNMPNPFSDFTTISFTLAKEDNVRIIVYNALGDKIEELTNRDYSAGKYEIKFNADYLPSGLYYYKISTSNFAETHIMNLLR